MEWVGEEVATPYFPEQPLFEPTLWMTNISKYYPHLRHKPQASQGILDAVTPSLVTAMVEKYGIDEEIRSLGYRLARTENASFIGFAGLAKGVEEGTISKSSNVILMITGKGDRPQFVQEQPDFIMEPRLHKPSDILSAVQGH